MMAATVLDTDEVVKLDPRYVQLVATLTKSTPDSYEELYVPMKPCTDTQFAKFYQVERSSEAQVQRLKAAKQFHCYDLEDEFDLYG